MQGVLIISVVFSTVHEVGREQGVYLLSRNIIYCLALVLANQVQIY